MNDARFTGNLTRDPESKTMTNGKLRTTFSLAVQRRRSNPQTGQREADFINFVAYDKSAEIAANYLTKGQKVLIASHVRTGKYERDGRTVYTTDFVVDNIEFLGSRQAQTEQAEPQPPEQADTGGFVEVEDDDLPF